MSRGAARPDVACVGSWGRRTTRCHAWASPPARPSWWSGPLPATRRPFHTLTARPGAASDSAVSPVRRDKVEVKVSAHSGRSCGSQTPDAGPAFMRGAHVSRLRAVPSAPEETRSWVPTRPVLKGGHRRRGSGGGPGRGVWMPAGTWAPHASPPAARRQHVHRCFHSVLQMGSRSETWLFVLEIRRAGLAVKDACPPPAWPLPRPPPRPPPGGPDPVEAPGEVPALAGSRALPVPCAPRSPLPRAEGPRLLQPRRLPPWVARAQRDPEF